MSDLRSLAHRGVVPPHLLKAMAMQGDAELQAWAHDSLALSARHQDQRTALAVIAPHAAGGRPEHRTIYDACGKEDLPGRLVRDEGDPKARDVAVNEAYDGLGATYALYQDVYQRNSIDGRGMPLIASVHYGRRYDNAVWDGRQMIFGDGDGRIFRRFTCAVDVIGHELTHGVTQTTANLAYRDQPGALNESFSDVFGSLVKQYGLRQTAQEADWLVGEGLFTPNVRGVALRSLKSPGTAYDDPVLGKDPQPATMRGYVSTEDDNGGVHINSGIPNHAFYLAAMEIGGYAWERTGLIWYGALTRHLEATATFLDAAIATVRAAGELFGTGGREQRAVRDAWEAVGVGGESVPDTQWRFRGR